MAKDETRRQILNVAGEIFAEKGFPSTTVRSISDRAGVNLAAVNYYFGDKERLYIEAVKHARRLRAEQEPLPEWSADTSPVEKLKMFIATFTRRIVGQDAAPWQMRLLVRELMEPTKACEEMVEEAFRPVFQLLSGILDELTDKRLPQHRVEQLAFSVFGQIVYYRVHERIVAMLVDPDRLAEHFQTAQLADHISDVILAAVAGLSDNKKSPSTVEESS